MSCCSRIDRPVPRAVEAIEWRRRDADCALGMCPLAEEQAEKRLAYTSGPSAYRVRRMDKHVWLDGQC